MITVRGNWLGIGMFVMGGIIAGIAGFILKLGDFVTMVSVGIFLILADLGFRFFINKKSNKLFGKETGGYFFFIPVWVLGIVVVIINVVKASGAFK